MKMQTGFQYSLRQHIKSISYSFYIVWWADAESHATWRELKDILKDRPPLCISSGWLVSENAERLVLVSDFNFNKKLPPEICDGGNTTIIPKGMVIKKQKVIL